ncbi:hypothetical protein EJ06DRAFT_308229 [Trichodelitschia bisporula]|uniref:Uncharacterized protein n=1 Tax=Trichodelitschia bisporula TaxID=703511 RepID=A0A6G1I448_9PEZI|nr:hypothetical protein EJ06DRAFT_308229 [Trichodelitschia bisporula]
MYGGSTESFGGRFQRQHTPLQAKLAGARFKAHSIRLKAQDRTKVKVKSLASKVAKWVARIRNRREAGVTRAEHEEEERKRSGLSGMSETAASKLKDTEATTPTTGPEDTAVGTETGPSTEAAPGDAGQSSDGAAPNDGGSLHGGDERKTLESRSDREFSGPGVSGSSAPAVGSASAAAVDERDERHVEPASASDGDGRHGERVSSSPGSSSAEPSTLVAGSALVTYAGNNALESSFPPEAGPGEPSAPAVVSASAEHKRDDEHDSTSSGPGLTETSAPFSPTVPSTPVAAPTLSPAGPVIPATGFTPIGFMDMSALTRARPVGSTFGATASRPIGFIQLSSLSRAAAARSASGAEASRPVGLFIHDWIASQAPVAAAFASSPAPVESASASSPAPVDSESAASAPVAAASTSSPAPASSQPAASARVRSRLSAPNPEYKAARSILARLLAPGPTAPPEPPLSPTPTAIDPSSPPPYHTLTGTTPMVSTPLHRPTPARPRTDSLQPLDARDPYIAQLLEGASAVLQEQVRTGAAIPVGTSRSSPTRQDADSQSRDADPQLKDTDSQPQDAESQAQYADSQARDVDSQAQDPDSQPQDPDSQSSNAGDEYVGIVLVDQVNPIPAVPKGTSLPTATGQLAASKPPLTASPYVTRILDQISTQLHIHICGVTSRMISIVVRDLVNTMLRAQGHDEVSPEFCLHVKAAVRHKVKPMVSEHFTSLVRDQVLPMLRDRVMPLLRDQVHSQLRTALRRQAASESRTTQAPSAPLGSPTPSECPVSPTLSERLVSSLAGSNISVIRDDAPRDPICRDISPTTGTRAEHPASPMLSNASTEQWSLSTLPSSPLDYSDAALLRINVSPELTRRHRSPTRGSIAERPVSPAPREIHSSWRTDRDILRWRADAPRRLTRRDRPFTSGFNVDRLGSPSLNDVLWMCTNPPREPIRRRRPYSSGSHAERPVFPTSSEMPSSLADRDIPEMCLDAPRDPISQERSSPTGTNPERPVSPALSEVLWMRDPVRRDRSSSISTSPERDPIRQERPPPPGTRAERSVSPALSDVLWFRDHIRRNRSPSTSASPELPVSPTQSEVLWWHDHVRLHRSHAISISPERPVPGLDSAPFGTADLLRRTYSLIEEIHIPEPHTEADPSGRTSPVGSDDLMMGANTSLDLPDRNVESPPAELDVALLDLVLHSASEPRWPKLLWPEPREEVPSEISMDSTSRVRAWRHWRRNRPVWLRPGRSRAKSSTRTSGEVVVEYARMCSRRRAYSLPHLRGTAYLTLLRAWRGSEGVDCEEHDNEEHDDEERDDEEQDDEEQDDEEHDDEEHDDEEHDDGEQGNEEQDDAEQDDAEPEDERQDDEEQDDESDDVLYSMAEESDDKSEESPPGDGFGQPPSGDGFGQPPSGDGSFQSPPGDGSDQPPPEHGSSGPPPGSGSGGPPPSSNPGGSSPSAAGAASDNTSSSRLYEVYNMVSMSSSGVIHVPATTGL